MPATKPAKHPPIPGLMHSPVTQGQRLIFQGYRNTILIPQNAFQALCGPQPPTITSAPVTVATVDRPRSLGYTVTTTYSPITMDVQIQFENWVGYTNPVNADVEGDIDKLWWMAGRGHLGPGNSANGDPPDIAVSAYDPSGQPSPLVPSQVTGYLWRITNLAWDTSPLRLDKHMINQRKLNVPVGTRARQLVTVSLQQTSDGPGVKNYKPKPGDFAVRSTADWNTVKKLAEVYCGRSDTQALKQIMNLTANKHLHLKATTQLKPNTKVMIPNSLKAY